MIRAGLFLYDHLAARKRLPRDRSGSTCTVIRPARRSTPRYRTGFAYSDGWVDDARLVLVNAIDAQERGAKRLPRAPLA